MNMVPQFQESVSYGVIQCHFWHSQFQTKCFENKSIVTSLANYMFIALK